MDGLPTMTTQTFIGILVAITGNVLISLALNLQKVAHKHVETLKKASNHGKQRSYSENNGYQDLSESRVSEGPSLDEHDEDRELLDVRKAQPDVFSDSPSETQSLVAFPESETSLRHYGTDANTGRSITAKPSKAKRSNASRLLPTRFLTKRAASGNCIPPDDNRSEEQLLPSRKGLDATTDADSQNSNSKEGSESDYLKSRIWLTINIIFQIDQWLIISC